MKAGDHEDALLIGLYPKQEQIRKSSQHRSSDAEPDIRVTMGQLANFAEYARHFVDERLVECEAVLPIPMRSLAHLSKRLWTKREPTDQPLVRRFLSAASQGIAEDGSSS
jgi:hypothetical protein